MSDREYIICSGTCGCIYGGKNSMSALLAGWVLRNMQWVCPKCKVADSDKLELGGLKQCRIR